MLIVTLMTQIFSLLITPKYLRYVKAINMSNNTHLISFNRKKIINLKDIENKLDDDRMEMNFEYIKCGLINIYM